MTKTFQYSLGISALALVAALIAPSASVFAKPAPDDDNKEEHAEKSDKKALWEIEDIMETTHKGKVSVVKKVIAGEATEAEIKLLLEQYLTMERLTPSSRRAGSLEEKNSGTDQGHSRHRCRC